MRTRLAKEWKQGRQTYAKIKDSDLTQMTSAELMAAYDAYYEMLCSRPSKMTIKEIWPDRAKNFKKTRKQGDQKQ